MTALTNCVTNECLSKFIENVPSLGVSACIYLKIQNKSLGIGLVINAFVLQAKPTTMQRRHSVLPEIPDHRRKRKEISPTQKTDQLC